MSGNIVDLIVMSLSSWATALRVVVESIVNSICGGGGGCLVDFSWVVVVVCVGVLHIVVTIGDE